MKYFGTFRSNVTDENLKMKFIELVNSIGFIDSIKIIDQLLRDDLENHSVYRRQLIRVASEHCFKAYNSICEAFGEL